MSTASVFVCVRLSGSVANINSLSKGLLGKKCFSG